MSAPAASGALLQLLRELPASVPPEEIDEIWLFPPRDLGGRESGLVVLALFAPDAPSADHRKVLTVRYEAEVVRGRLQRSDTVAEQGFAPAGRVPGVISGVLRRLGDGSEAPVSTRVAGDARRWEELLRSLGAEPVDRVDGE